MYHFGTHSKAVLEDLHPDLQKVLYEAIKTYDFTAFEGFRSKERQNKAYDEGKSQLRFPHSKHNQFPCEAVDCIPYPAGFKATHEEWNMMATHILAAASRVGVAVDWGGHWKSLVDKPHFELRR